MSSAEQHLRTWEAEQAIHARHLVQAEAAYFAFSSTVPHECGARSCSAGCPLAPTTKERALLATLDDAVRSARAGAEHAAERVAHWRERTLRERAA